VRGEAFDFGKFVYGGESFLQRTAVVFDEAGAALELIDGEAGKGKAGAASGKGMAWTGDVITEDSGRPGAEEDCAGGFDLFGDAPWLTSHDFAMLRRELIGESDAVLEGCDLDKPGIVEGFADEIATRERFELLVDFFFDGFEEFPVGGDEPDAFVSGPVLGLREQIGGCEFCLGGVIGEDHEFAGTGEEIDGDVADDQAFGGDDVSVARAEDFLYAANCVSAVGHSGDGLCAADTVNLGGSGNARGVEQGGVDRTVFAAGRADHDFRTACDFRQGHGHQGRRHQWGGAAGDVNADALEWIEFFTYDSAVRVTRLPILAQGTSREGGDVFFGFGDGGAQAFICFQRGGQEFGLSNGELVGGQTSSVETFRQFEHGVVAALVDGFENGARALFDGGVEQAGRSGDSFELLGEIAIRMAEQFHGNRG